MGKTNLVGPHTSQAASQNRNVACHYNGALLVTEDIQNGSLKMSRVAAQTWFDG
jgi:hypothetical protein